MSSPFPFAFLSAFSVPRSRHPRPSDARSPSRDPLRASSRCGLLPQSKFGSPSADPFQSPREWVATAHPLGKHVPQTADKPEETEPNTMFNKVILIGRLGQNAEAKTAQSNREYVVLNICHPGKLEERQAKTRPAPNGTASTPGRTSRSTPASSGRGSSSPSKGRYATARSWTTSTV